MDTATLTHTETETVETGRQFSHHDRCDHCGFQAWIVATRKRVKPSVHALLSDEETQELLLCKNRGDKFTPALVAAGWDVVDFTHMINEKPTDPSDDEF